MSSRLDKICARSICAEPTRAVRQQCALRVGIHWRFRWPEAAAALTCSQLLSANANMRS